MKKPWSILPLTLVALSAVMSFASGAAGAERNFSAGASFALPLFSQTRWEVEGEPLDSHGEPKLERELVGSILSTM